MGGGRWEEEGGRRKGVGGTIYNQENQIGVFAACADVSIMLSPTLDIHKDVNRAMNLLPVAEPLMRCVSLKYHNSLPPHTAEH